MKATKATVAKAAVISSAITAIANKISDFPVHAKTANKRFVKAISPPAKNIVLIVPALIAIIPPNNVNTTVVFTLLGGIMAMRAGTIKTMFFAGGLMAITNLLFAVLAWTGKSEILFAIAVIADDITAAFATVAFVAFISLLVDRTYTATQYALLASIGTAGRTTLASSSGALVDWLNGDWGTFFVLTTIMVIPSLICLWLIRNKIKIGAK